MNLKSEYLVDSIFKKLNNYKAKKIFLENGYNVNFLRNKKINKIIKNKSEWEAICLVNNVE